MRTDELIALLAQGAGPAPRAPAARRLAPGAVLGVAASALLAWMVWGWIPTPLYTEPAPWFKLAYAGALALAAAWLTARLGRPLPRITAPLGVVAAVLSAALLAGLAAWWQQAQGSRLPSLLGHSAAECPWNILGLSLPALGAALWALRGLAPTRPVAAGAAAGLLAGALGALGYALACTEMALSFVAAWYTLGMLLTAGAGAVLGPRVLRW